MAPLWGGPSLDGRAGTSRIQAVVPLTVVMPVNGRGMGREGELIVQEGGWLLQGCSGDVTARDMNEPGVMDQEHGQCVDAPQG